MSCYINLFKLSGTSTEDTLFIRTEWDICNSLRTKQTAKQRTQKKHSAYKKRGPSLQKKYLKFISQLHTPPTIFSSLFYKKLKLLSSTFYFPFFPFLSRSHFHRPPIFIFAFRHPHFLHSMHRAIHTTSPLFTAFYEVIHLIHSLMHVFLKLAPWRAWISKFRLFHGICQPFAFLCTLSLSCPLILIHNFTWKKQKPQLSRCGK